MDTNTLDNQLVQSKMLSQRNFHYKRDRQPNTDDISKALMKVSLCKCSNFGMFTKHCGAIVELSIEVTV